MNQEQVLRFFFLLKKLKQGKKFYFTIYFTSSEMSSLSKLTLEPFCLTNSPQSSKWKSLLPQGLFFHLVTLSSQQLDPPG